MYQDWDKDQIYIFLITNYHIIPPQPQRNRGEHWYQNPERECVEEAALRGAAVLVKKHRQPKAGPRSRYPGLPLTLGFPRGPVVKRLSAAAGDTGSLRKTDRVRKMPWRRKRQPLQVSALRNPMDRGAWRSAVHEAAKSQTWVSGWTQGPYSTL